MTTLTFSMSRRRSSFETVLLQIEMNGGGIKMKRAAAFLVSFAILLLLGSNAHSEEKGEVRLGCYMGLLTAPVLIAEKKGYFQEEGIAVTIKEFDTGIVPFSLMLSEKKLDMVTVAQTPVVKFSFSRNDYVIVASFVSSYNDAKVLGRSDHGVHLPQDLKGKKVGFTKGTTGQFFLHRFLTSAGLLSTAIQEIDLPAEGLIQALVEGKVDAISSWEPYIYRAKKALAVQAIVLSLPQIFRLDLYFSPRKEFLEKYPERVKAFLRAIQKAEEFIQNHREESIRIVTDRLKVDLDFTNSAWDDYDYELMLDPSIFLTLEDQARWMIKNHLVEETEVPNYVDFIDPAPLEEVHPDGVRIIR